MVECLVANEKVRGSNPLCRSSRDSQGGHGGGLKNLRCQFDSDSLHLYMGHIDDELPNGADLADHLDGLFKTGQLDKISEQNSHAILYLSGYFSTFVDQTSSEFLEDEELRDRRNLQGAQLRVRLLSDQQLAAARPADPVRELTLDILLAVTTRQLNSYREERNSLVIGNELDEDTDSLTHDAIAAWEEIEAVVKAAADPENPYHEKFK